MTEYIKHRANTIDALNSTPINYGIEVDIRSNGSDLVIHHDPFERGVLFSEWMSFYKHGTLILNVKEEGLEPYLIKKMDEVGCMKYFFLDQTFPFLLRYAEKCNRKSAVRFSEYESIDTVLAVSDQVSWLWVDCFTKFPIDQHSAEIIKSSGLKICLVSPELQGRKHKSEIVHFKKTMSDLGLSADAVCTKYPADWEALWER